MSRNSDVTIIVPTYNEHDNILPLVERIDRGLKDYRILFVDDNSRDGTAELISGLSGKYPVSVMVRRDKRGLASAVVDGLKQVSGGIVGVMDADLQHPPEILPELVSQVRNGAGMAIASRYTRGGSCRGWGLTRRIISKGAIALAHVFLPITRRIQDPMSGYFVFQRQAVDENRLKPSGYKILLEMLAQGNFQSVVEVPYTFDTRSRGESKLKARTQIDYLKHIVSLMRRTGELRRFLKFCLVGLSGVGVNLGILTLLTQAGGIDPRYSSAVAIEVSIITNFLLNDFLTFTDRRSQGSRLRRLVRFNGVCAAGAAINWGLFNLFYGVFDMHYVLAQLIGIAVATLWNYIFSTLWAWR